MGEPQFSQIVAGTVQAQANLSYPRGDVLDVDGSSYNYSVNPSWDIQELIIHDAGDVEATITTTGGDTFTIPISTGDVYNRWEVDSVTFKDPNGTTAALAASYAGES